MARKFGYKADGAKQAKEGCRTSYGKTVRPVGYEREVKGYIIVKTALYPTVPQSKDNWKLKHVHIWEQANNKTLPKGWIVRFRDGNNRNFDINNLCAMPRGLNQMINRWAAQLGIKEMDAETFDVVYSLAKIQKKTHEKKITKPRKCSKCGRWFTPDIYVYHGHQRATNKQKCRDCIEKQRSKQND